MTKNQAEAHSRMLAALPKREHIQLPAMMRKPMSSRAASEYAKRGRKYAIPTLSKRRKP